MARQWTRDQIAAIETSGCDLLVSAGAGSGKTAVLTERIIRRLTDEENPADITRLLVVTFTKAAAGELKEKITAAIEGALLENPGDKRLTRQLLALDRAKISTIHSFCLDVLKEYAGSDLLPSDFRIADDTEITLLKKSIMNDLIEEYYISGEIADFGSFADLFVGTKSDSGLADAFLKIEKQLESYPEYVDFIKKSADNLAGYDGKFENTLYFKELIGHIVPKFREYREIFSGSLSEISSDEKLTKAYFDAFTSDIDFIDSALSALENGTYGEICRVFESYTSTRIGSVRSEYLSQELIFAKDIRKEFLKYRGECAEKYFSFTDEEIKNIYARTASELHKLYILLDAFCKRFSEEKRKRSIVDYTDLERLTYALLGCGGEPTEAALSIRERFDEIYIDEYQDVNAVQDAIFSAASRGNNRFMVGDIKQSIYAFRGSDPQIFADYRRRFTDTDDGGKSVFLSANFRCDKSIIDFTNIVSLCLFTSGRGDVDFRHEDLLVNGKSEGCGNEPVHIALIDGIEDEESGEVSAVEARYIATEIARLIKEGKKNDGTPIRPSDIAILMRSPAAHSTALSEELDRVGIPYYNNVAGEFFENAEVLLALCLINTIDNPTRDIYLAGALRSPVFAFTLSDLIRVRKAYPEGCLYDALVSYCETTDFEKGRYFLEKLNIWRTKAAGMRVDRLLWYIYTDTDLLALVYDKENATRRANLMLLYEYARRFESSSFKGLYNFIRYINDILDEKAKLETAKVFGEASDTVKFMSIHQSKGLEFPVCFICGTSKKFNANDLRQNAVIDKTLGAALKLSDESGFGRYDTLIHKAIIRRIADNQLEEEMRILYVAMTRARERLYLTALTKDPEKMLSAAAADSRRLSESVIMKNNGYMRWILTAIEYHKLVNPDSPLPCTVDIVSSTTAGEIVVEAPAEDTETKESAENTEADYATFVRQRLDFKYPTPASAKLPAKLSVSRLHPDILDEDDGTELPDEAPVYNFSEKRPFFLESDITVLPVTAAERGTATHAFMQFCDFSRFSPEDSESILREKIIAEAARLAESKFITKRATELINVKQAAAFFRSDLFARIKSSKTVMREKRFNVRLAASNFTEDADLAKELEKEHILVQGIIDCFFENPDGSLTLLDYKTDHIPPEMSREEAEKLLSERHRLQLSYYKQALEKISLRPVASTLIYSFSGGFSVEI